MFSFYMKKGFVFIDVFFILDSMMDNIIASKLYRAGSVGYVSKPGGMSNELNNILSLNNGTYEDRYPIDHLCY